MSEINENTEFKRVPCLKLTCAIPCSCYVPTRSILIKFSIFYARTPARPSHNNYLLYIYIYIHIYIYICVCECVCIYIYVRVCVRVVYVSVCLTTLCIGQFLIRVHQISLQNFLSPRVVVSSRLKRVNSAYLYIRGLRLFECIPFLGV